MSPAVSHLPFGRAPVPEKSLPSPGKVPDGLEPGEHVSADDAASCRLISAGGVQFTGHGVYRVGGHVLHVSAGVGYTFLPFRVGVPPEVTLIELRRSTPPAATPAT